jgi:polysaccharide pyruvyl transferase WcaK-like protein
MEKLVLFLSGTGFFNYGDEEILARHLRFIRKEEMKFKVISPNPKATQKHQDISEENIYERPKILGFFHILFLLLFDSNLRNLVKNSSFIVSTGGNHTSYNRNELYFKLLIYFLAGRYDVPIKFGAQTIGPFYFLDFYLVKWVVSRVIKKDNKQEDRIPVRDEPSQRLLNSMGISSFVTRDDAYNMKAIPSSFPIRNRIRIGINLKSSANLYGGDLDKAFNMIYKLCLALLVAKQKIVLYLIPFSKDDIELLCLLKEELAEILFPEQTKRVRLLSKIGSAPSGTLKGIIGEMDFNIGMRYHFCVFSKAKDIPFIGIYAGDYQGVKLEGLMQTDENIEGTNNMFFLDMKNVSPIDQAELQVFIEDVLNF